MLAEMSAKEMRNINPTIAQLCEAVDILIAAGWSFRNAQRPGVPWNEGWWINQAHSTKCRPVGDSKDFHLAAWDTIKCYVKEN
jgi:hypothetical protein